jgi:hypothetical protein
VGRRNKKCIPGTLQRSGVRSFCTLKMRLTRVLYWQYKTARRIHNSPKTDRECCNQSVRV